MSDGAGPVTPGYEDRPSSGRSLLVRVIVGAVVAGGLLGVWGIAAGATAFSAARELVVARDELSASERSLRDAELTIAREQLTAAVDASSSASSRLNRIHMVPLRVVPVLGPNLRAATTLSDTARDVGSAAAELLDVAAVIVSDDRSQEPGEISLEYLEELGPPLRELVTTLQHSTAEVVELDPQRLIGRITDARGRFLEVVEPNLEQAALAADLIEALPSFLGEDEPRTYLVGAAALSEIRGSGGLLGSWTVMRASEGKMSFEAFVDVDELPVPTGDVASPSDDFERRYARYGGLRTWRNVNISPDFPAVAEVVMRLYEEGGGDPVDGVIVADAVVFERLSERSGGLQVPGVGRLAPQDTLQFVGLDAYAAFDDDDQRKRVLGATATAAFAELFQILEDDDVPATVEMLASIADGGHLLMHVRDGSIQPVFERAGVAGELPHVDGESVGIFVSNFAENKLDYFSERSIDHHIRLADGGVTHATIGTRIVNDAPQEGYPRAVLGPWVEGTAAGENVSLVTVACSRSCTFTTVPDAAGDGGAEQGRPMQDAIVRTRAGETLQLTYETTSRSGWRIVDGQLVVEVDDLIQPTIHGTTLRVRIDVPPGYEVVAAPPGAQVEGDHVVWEDGASGRTRLSFAFSRSPERSAAP